MSLLFPHGCIVIRYDTTATARWTLPFIFRAFFNDTITVAVWTGFHVRRMHMLPHLSNGRAAMGSYSPPLYPPKSGLHARNIVCMISRSRARTELSPKRIAYGAIGSFGSANRQRLT